MKPYHRILTVATVVVAATAALLWAPPETTPSAEAAPASTTTTFAISDVRDVPRQGVSDRMYAFLFDVDAGGGATLERTFLVRGKPPRFRDHPDARRIYRWSLLDAGGATISTGLHLDRIALYTVREDGGCDRTLAEEHSMMVRVPWSPEATHVSIEIEAVHGDVKEGR